MATVAAWEKKLPVQIHFKTLLTMDVNIPLTKASHMAERKDKCQGKHTPSLVGRTHMVKGMEREKEKSKGQ